MRDFLYKNSFIRFYATLAGQRLTLKNNGLISIIVFGVLMFFGTLFSPSMFTNFFVELVCIVALVLFVLCQVFGVRIKTVPNSASILPLSHGKKAAWYMLSPLFATAVGLIAFFIAALVLYGISCLISYCIGAEIEAFMDYEELYAVQQVGLQGGIFCAIYLIIGYSVGTVAGLTKKKPYKYLTLVSYVVINVFTFILISALTPSEYIGGDMLFIYRCSPFIASSYAVMPNLWVILLVYGLAAAGLLGLAIYLVGKRFSPKKY